MKIRRPRPPKALPTAEDRQSLDFSRFYNPTPSELPSAGIAFTRLLSIATEVCGREIRELGQLRTKGEVERVKRALRKEKRG